MSNIAMFSYEQVFSNEGIASGPSSRLWEIAKALRDKNHKITIFEAKHTRDHSKENIKLRGITENIKKSLKRCQAAFIPNSNYAKNFFSLVKDMPLIVDLTAPITIESLMDFMTDADKKNPASFFVEDGYIPTIMSLLNGDYFICSTPSQRDYYLGMLSALGRTTKDNVKEIVQIVPSSIPKERPIKPKTEILKKKLGIYDKKIILWPGSLFSWFDYELIIKSIHNLSLKRSDFVLVFVGGVNPGIQELTLKNYNKANEMCRKLGILNNFVFFIDWLPYKDRAAMYFESDFAVITYFNNIETRFSYRTRIADCLWGRLPVICTEGGSMADEIRKNSLGKVIAPGDINSLEAAITQLLDNPNLLKAYSKNIDEFVDKKFNLNVTISKLSAFCKKPRIDKDKGRFSVFNFIDEKEQKNRELKDLVNSKDHTVNYLGETNEKLNSEVYRLTNELNFHKSEHLSKVKDTEALEIQLRDLRTISEAAKERLSSEINTLSEQIKSYEKMAAEKDKIILKQSEFIGRYRKSIMYPFYKMSSGIGKTKIGLFLQRMLK